MILNPLFANIEIHRLSANKNLRSDHVHMRRRCQGECNVSLGLVLDDNDIANSVCPFERAKTLAIAVILHETQVDDRLSPYFLHLAQTQFLTTVLASAIIDSSSFFGSSQIWWHCDHCRSTNESEQQKNMQMSKMYVLSWITSHNILFKHMIFSIYSCIIIYFSTVPSAPNSIHYLIIEVAQHRWIQVFTALTLIRRRMLKSISLFDKLFLQIEMNGYELSALKLKSFRANHSANFQFVHIFVNGLTALKAIQKFDHIESEIIWSKLIGHIIHTALKRE